MESILVGVNNFFAIFSKISSFLWSFPTQFSGWKSIPVLGQFTLLVLLLLGAGIWFTIKTGFVQIKNFKKGIKILSQKKSVEIGISPFASFMLSSAMRIGAGNITGVTGAIAVGGPGALFWMWLSAFFGMATAFVEATLSQIFKERKGDEYVGGLTHYAEKIFRNKLSTSNRATNLVRIVSCFIMVPLGCLCVLANLELGNMWSVSDLINAIFILINVPTILIGSKIAFAALKDYVKTNGKPFTSDRIGVKTSVWTKEFAESYKD